MTKAAPNAYFKRKKFIKSRFLANFNFSTEPSQIPAAVQMKFEFLKKGKICKTLQKFALETMKAPPNPYFKRRKIIKSRFLANFNFSTKPSQIPAAVQMKFDFFKKLKIFRLHESTAKCSCLTHKSHQKLIFKKF